MKKIKEFIFKVRLIFRVSFEDLQKGLDYSKLDLQERVELDTEEILKELRKLADRTELEDPYVSLMINRLQTGKIDQPKKPTFFLQIQGLEGPPSFHTIKSVLDEYENQISK